MASPLAKLSTTLAKGFKGKLLTGVVRRYTYTINTKGDRVVSGHTDYPYQSGIRESFDAKWRAQALIPETDFGILILLGSIGIRPDRDDDVQLPDGTWAHVRQVLEIDPASASIRLQAYQIPAPS